MSVLVTGAAGFIGSHFVDHLLGQGVEVVGLDNFDDFYGRRIKEQNLTSALDHEGFSLIEGDIRDTACLEGISDSIDAVVHLAAKVGVRPSILDPLAYTDVNLMGTSLLLEFARERAIGPFVRFLLVGLWK